MEEKADECKNAVATTTDIPSNASSSHFLRMAMRHHPKLNIKIPKFMHKIMQTRTSQKTERGYHFPKRVVSVFFSKVFRKKRLLCEKADDQGEPATSIESSDSHDGKEKRFTSEGNDLLLSQITKLELDNAVNKNAIISLESFVGGHNSCNGEAKGEQTNNIVNGWEVWRTKVTSSRLVKVVSSIMSITSWLKKKVSMEDEDEYEYEDAEEGVLEEEEEEACLCKKRILMGGRCKPLYSSGALEYDSDGILIPDHLLGD